MEGKGYNRHDPSDPEPLPSLGGSHLAGTAGRSGHGRQGGSRTLPASAATIPWGCRPHRARLLHAQGAFTRPVVQEGITVYVNSHGVTATGAQPVDAVRGFTPAKTGESHGPWTKPAGCFEGDLPPQTLHDHATFTPAELHQYGLRSAADLGLPFDEWASQVRNIEHVSCTSRTVYEDGVPLTAGMLKRLQSQSNTQALDTCIDFCGAIEYTPPDTGCPGTTVFICVDRHTDHFEGGEVSWTGFGTDRYVAPNRTLCNPAVCPPLTEVTSYWHVPTAHPKGVNFDDSYHWIGLGGLHSFAVGCDGETSNPSLVQTGTRSYHFQGTATYDMWFENCSAPNFGLQDTFFAPSPGDLMDATIGSTDPANAAGIWLQDQTQHWTVNLPTGPGGTWPAPDQNTAECVSEVPAHNWPGGTPNGVWQGETDWGNLGIHFEFCRAWTGYNSASIIGIGSVPNDALLLWRSYVLDGVPTYCSSTQWFDSFNATYGYTSYAATALATYAEGGSANC